VQDASTDLPTLFDGRSPVWRVLADVAAIVALVALGLTVWPMDGDPGVPWWAGPSDPLLEGPDSGAWAANILAWTTGDTQYLEPQRMPTFILFSGAASAWTANVALAGHLVNHLAHLLSPLCVYGIGRLMGSRSVGIGAGMLTAVCPFLVQASWRFGVDPTVAFIIPFSLFMALLAARWWWLGPLAGLAGGLAMTAHFTTLFHAVPPAIAILLFSRGWGNRSKAFLGYGIGVFLTWKLIFQTFVWGGVATLSEAVPEGIVKGAQGTAGQTETDWSGPLAVLQENIGDAVGNSIQLVMGALHGNMLPWEWALVCAWLGVLGIGLGRVGEKGRMTRWLGLLEWRGGLVLLLSLGPLPLLAAAQAEARYSYNLLPIVALLFVRGMVGPLLLLDRVICRVFKRWRAGVLALIVVFLVGRDFWGASLWKHKPLPPPMSARAGWLIGKAINANFDAVGGVVCPFREAIPYTGGRYCPKTRCPSEVNIEAFWDCAEIMDAQCDGEGPLPYVVIWRRAHDERDVSRKAMDQWAIETWGTVEEIAVPLRTPEFMADIVSIPRKDIRARKKTEVPAE
jgi:hypothetical protein